MSDLIVARIESTIAAGHDLLQQLCKYSDDMQLDAFYMRVLSTCSSDNREMAVKLLGTIAILDVHATPTLLVTLLQLSPRKLEVVSLLQSLVDALILTTETPLNLITETTTLRVCHDSLRGFLTDPRRCRVTRYLVSPADCHEALLDGCLLLLNEHLRQDICEIRNLGLANAEVSDLPARIELYVPEALRYACLSWPVHLHESGSLSGAVSAGLLHFCTEHLLHWLEALSLLGKLSSADNNIPKVIAWCQVSVFLVTRCSLIRTNRIISWTCL
jgi:hypothetical protein